MATTAADNGGLIMTEGVEKNGFCVFSILMSAKEAVCPDGRIVPAVFQVSGFYCNSLFLMFIFCPAVERNIFFSPQIHLRRCAKEKKTVIVLSFFIFCW